MLSRINKRERINFISFIYCLFSILAIQLMVMIHGLIAAVISNNFPRILTGAYNQTLNVSDTAILTCYVENLGNHHVTWLKYDSTTLTYLPLTVGEQVFYSDTRYFVSSYSTLQDHTYWNLEISNIKTSDEGLYECKISNRHTSVSIQIYLQVQTPMTIQPSYLHVEPGSFVELDCIIYNTDALSITWHFSNFNQKHRFDMHHNDIYEKHHRDKNISKSKLIIRHAQPYHSGLWTCTFKRQRRSAKLFVEKGLLKKKEQITRRTHFFLIESSRICQMCSLVCFLGALQHHQQQRLLSNNYSSFSIQSTMSLILFTLLLGHHMTHRI